METLKKPKTVQELYNWLIKDKSVTHEAYECLCGQVASLLGDYDQQHAFCEVGNLEDALWGSLDENMTEEMFLNVKNLFTNIEWID